VRILITAGPTREYFDSVRFISNPSSGKMGFALAIAAARRGHDVLLVAGPVNLPDPPSVKVVRVVTASQMARACKRAWGRCDVGIMTAAICDYRPQRRLTHKLHKQARPRQVMLLPTEDIASSLGRRKGDRFLVGFAMEDHDARHHAEQKLQRKRCDLIVLNGPENIGGDRARVQVLAAGPGQRWQVWPAGPKSAVAARLIRLIERLSAARARRRGR
jgi:phosphopantothenoylcysteine decarboxylase/phosphopantothenate--cysteine ligase